MERNILILHDITPETDKAQVESLFDNEACTPPIELHSEIGGPWLCRFDSEEHCLAAIAHLRQFGQINGEPLHVCVKAVYDKNKGDTLPQMSQKSTSKKSTPKKGSAQRQIVSIDKMDDKSVNWSEDCYNEIKGEVDKLLTKIGSVLPRFYNSWETDRAHSHFADNIFWKFCDMPHHTAQRRIRSRSR